MSEDDPLYAGYADTHGHRRAKPVPGTLYGAAEIINPDVVWWADDHAGCVALRECGYEQVVACIPPPQSRIETGADIFRPLGDPRYSDFLARAGKIILCTPDRAHVEELARRLGRHRVWRVRWPAEASNIHRALQDYGIASVRGIIDAAEPWPLSGVHQPSGQMLLDWRYTKPPGTMTTGTYALDKILHLPMEGRLIVWTGIPGHGKSTLLTQVMAHTAGRYERRWAVFSPEMTPWESLVADVAQWRAGKPFYPPLVPGVESMSDADIKAAGEWAKNHFSLFVADDEDPTLDWLIERAVAAVLRGGATDFVIDPWNEVDHHWDGLREDIYLGRAIRRLKAFANRHGCNVHIVAHPTKLKPAKPGDAVPVPTAYDIAGGAMWANKPDIVVVVHRPETVTQVHVIKTRFRRFGRRGDMVEIILDPLTGRFYPNNHAEAGREPVEPAWHSDIPTPEDDS